MVIVAVRRPSGDLFEVDVPKDATLNTLKAAIAAKTKEAVTRQKLLLGHEVLSDEMLGLSQGGFVVQSCYILHVQLNY